MSNLNSGPLLIVVSATWVASELILVVFRRSGSTAQKRDAGSVVWTNVVSYSSAALGVTVGLAGPGSIEPTRLFFPWLGVGLMLSGMAIRWTAILTLRRFFTVDVAIHSDQRIVQTGLYRVIRHPSYTGMIISFVGLGIAFDNWISILLIVIPVAVAIIKRIEIEEKALLDAFGEEYARYSRSTRRLIPWVY